MSWFNSLTFTEEEIEVQRGEIALPRSQCWRGAKQGCKPKFLDLTPMWLLSLTVSPVIWGASRFSCGLLLSLCVGRAPPNCLSADLRLAFGSFYLVQVLWVCLASWLPPSRLLGHHHVFLQMVFGYETTDSLDFYFKY